MPCMCIQGFVQDKAGHCKNNKSKVIFLQEPKFELSIRLDFKNSENAETIFSSIMPEIDSGKNKRSETIVKVKNSSISLDIGAGDKTALRASLNSCLKTIILAEEIL